MLPKVEGPWDIHYHRSAIWPSSRRVIGVKKPILVHAMLETAEGVNNVERDRGGLAAHARHEPRPGRSRRLARDEDDAGRRRPPGIHACWPTRRGRAARPLQQDLWHYTIARMVDACAAAGIKPLLRPVRRLLRSRGLRGAVPQRFPDGLRRRLDAAPQPDRHRQAGFFARPRARSPSRKKFWRPCPTAPAPP